MMAIFVETSLQLTHGEDHLQAESKLYHAYALDSGINADPNAMRAGLRHQSE